MIYVKVQYNPIAVRRGVKIFGPDYICQGKWSANESWSEART